MIEAEISLSLPDKWIKEVVEKYPSVIKVINSKAMDGTQVRDLVQIEVENEEDLPKVIESVRKNPNIFNVDINEIDRGRVLAAFSTNECVVCRLLAGTECFLTRSITKNGRLIWTMLVTDKKALQALINGLEGVRADPKLVRLVEMIDTDALTQRQEQITRMAFEQGYFDFPRKVGLRELARSFNISTSTLSEITQERTEEDNDTLL